MTRRWRTEFKVQPQLVGDLTHEENEMACGLACMEMIEIWATKASSARSVWKRATRVTKDDLVKDGLTPAQMCRAANKVLTDCQWTTIDENEMWEIPHRVTSDTRDGRVRALVLAQTECLWPPGSGWDLHDYRHFVLLTQFHNSREHGWIASVADPLRHDYLAYERWPRVLERLHAAAIIKHPKA
jgi:hypothetical protein